MKRSQGFTIIELLIASAIGLVMLGVIYAAHHAGWVTFQFNEERISAISKLWLSMDKIKRDIRGGKEFVSPDDFYDDFLVSIPEGSLAFTTIDTTIDAIAFYTEDGDLYKRISDPTSTPIVITSGVNLSQVTSGAFGEINLTTSWTYRGTTRQESISSDICLRNWERE